MSLTKAQRKALADEGLGKDELAKLETILADDADAGSNGSKGGKAKGSRRVVVYEGDDAETFMRGLFKGSADDDADDDAGDAADDDPDDDDEGDDEPPSGPKWFR